MTEKTTHQPSFVDDQRVHLTSAVVGIVSICYAIGCGISSIIILLGSLGLGGAVGYWLIEISNNDTFDFLKNIFLEKCGIPINPKKSKKNNIENDDKNEEKTRKMPWEGLKITASLNESLENLLNEIVEQYVNGWYGGTISRDRAFLNEIRYQLRYSCANLIRRIQQINLSTFVGEKAIPTALLHAKRLNNMEIQIREMAENRNRDIAFPRSMIESKMAETLEDCHIALTNREQESEYLKQVADFLIPRLLDETRLAGRAHDDYNLIGGTNMGGKGKNERAWPSKSVRCFLREMLTNAVLLPVIDLLTQPDTINYWLILLFDENKQTHIYDHVDRTEVAFLKGLTVDGNVDNVPDSLLQLKLSEILRDSRLYAIFRMYLQDIRGPVHELQFLAETTRIHESIQRKLETASQISYDIWQLYGQFIHESAQERVYLEEELMEKYKEAVESKDLEVLEGIIEASYQVVYNRMQSDHVVSFCQSECFLGHLCGSPPVTINELIDRDAQEKRKNAQVERTFSLSQLRARVRKALTSIGDEEEEEEEDGTKMEEIVVQSPESQGSSAGSFVNIPSIDIISEEGSGSESGGASSGEVEESIAASERLEKSTGGLIMDADARDLNNWKVNVAKVVPLKNPLTDHTIYVFVIEVERPDAKAHETKYWSIHRSFNEFYVLENKLNVFHGDSLRFSPLPPRKTFAIKNRPYMEQHRLIFSTFLSTLCKQKILNRSELLLAFLSSNEEFRDTLMLSDLNPWKVVKKMPGKLSRERGQNLKPYLLKTLATTLAPTTPTQSVEQRGSEEETRSIDSNEQQTTLAMNAIYSSTYGNNFGGIVDVTKARNGVSSDASAGLWTKSIFDSVLMLFWSIFESSAKYMLHILSAIRLFSKNTIDSAIISVLDSVFDRSLCVENLVYLIQHVQHSMFCNDDPLPTEQEMMMREELAKRRTLEFVHKRKNYWMEKTMGEETIRHVINQLLEAIQYPRMNKQLVYILLDQLMLEAFPELDDSTHHPLQ